MRRSQRALLRANAEAVAGVLHVSAGDDLAIDGFDRAADMEFRVGCIGFQRRFTRKRNQFIVCHALVLKAGHGACASQHRFS